MVVLLQEEEALLTGLRMEEGIHVADTLDI